MSTPDTPILAPRTARAIEALHSGRGTKTAAERIERFSRLLSFVRASDHGAEIFELPYIWSTMTTSHRVSWARINWLRLIS